MFVVLFLIYTTADYSLIVYDLWRGWGIDAVTKTISKNNNKL